MYNQRGTLISVRKALESWSIKPIMVDKTTEDRPRKTQLDAWHRDARFESKFPRRADFARRMLLASFEPAAERADLVEMAQISVSGMRQKLEAELRGGSRTAARLLTGIFANRRDGSH
jgi:hypothetical protein